MANTNPLWSLYRADNARTPPRLVLDWLQEENVPPWRWLRTVATAPKVPGLSDAAERRGKKYVSLSPAEELKINMALLLRRPLLVTGRPGIGKTMLAYHLAWKLGLGEPLRWNIGSQSTLHDGLYHYDAIGHLHARDGGKGDNVDDIGDHITLGPLGTALLPTALPRVLLIDELDKATFDLPHDLLHVFEEGSYTIPELQRSSTPTSSVTPCDAHLPGAATKVSLEKGALRARHHPVVVVTSNDERDFPEALVRRCVRLEMKTPTGDKLRDIVRNHLPGADEAQITTIEGLMGTDPEATDVFLQTLFLIGKGGDAKAVLDVLRRGRA